MKRKLIIIGAGPAGYTAAIYAARSALNPLLISGPQPGGQLMITTDVENYPGFEKAVQGPWLMEQMCLQALHCGTDVLEETIVRLDLTQRPFRVFTDTKKEFEAEALIIATGAQAKWLSIESETKFRGFGVSACATCDGFFFKNQTVVVIGGGNTAVEEAIHLTHHAKEVIVVHRRDSFRAEKIMQDRLMNNKKIHVIWNHVADEILGEEKPLRVTGIRLRDVQTNVMQEIKADGVFIAIGHKPMSAFVKDQLACDSDGYIITEKGSTKTSIPGVFAAGDVQDKIFRQAVTAAGQGCMAALEAANFL